MEHSEKGLSQKGQLERSKLLSKVRQKAQEVDKYVQLARLAPPSYILKRSQTSYNSFQQKLEALDDELEKEIKIKKEELDEKIEKVKEQLEKLEKQKKNVRKEAEDLIEEKRQKYEAKLQEHSKVIEAEMNKINPSLITAKLAFDNIKQEYENIFGKCPIQLAENLFSSQPVPIVPQPVIQNVLPSKTFIELKEKLPTIHFEGVDIPAPSSVIQAEKSSKEMREEVKRIQREQEQQELEYKEQQRELREKERKAKEQADLALQDKKRKEELEKREALKKKGLTEEQIEDEIKKTQFLPTQPINWESDDEDSSSDTSSTATWIKESMAEDKLNPQLDEKKAVQLSREKRKQKDSDNESVESNTSYKAKMAERMAKAKAKLEEKQRLKEESQENEECQTQTESSSSSLETSSSPSGTIGTNTIPVTSEEAKVHLINLSSFNHKKENPQLVQEPEPNRPQLISNTKVKRPVKTIPKRF